MRSALLLFILSLSSLLHPAASTPAPTPGGTFGSEEVGWNRPIKTLAPTIDTVGMLGRGTPTKAPTIKPTYQPTPTDDQGIGNLGLPGVDFDAIPGGPPSVTPMPSTYEPTTYEPTTGTDPPAFVAAAQMQQQNDAINDAARIGNVLVVFGLAVGGAAAMALQ